MYTCVLVNRCTSKTRSHPFAATYRGRESYWACPPLIGSSLIWYHCNQISDDAEYSISGFGQSSVTFVAEKWHGTLVPNVITELASWTLRTVKSTDTSEEGGLKPAEAHTRNMMFKYTGKEKEISRFTHCIRFSRKQRYVACLFSRIIFYNIFILLYGSGRHTRSTMVIIAFLWPCWDMESRWIFIQIYWALLRRWIKSHMSFLDVCFI